MAGALADRREGAAALTALESEVSRLEVSAIGVNVRPTRRQIGEYEPEAIDNVKACGDESTCAHVADGDARVMAPVASTPV